MARQNKREPKRIEWRIVKRLVILLYHNRRIKKTNVAMKSGLSYDRCISYLDWMEVMDLIKRDIDEEGFELISLSDKGKDLYERKFRNEYSDFMN